MKYLEESRDEGCAVLGTSISQKALDIQTLSLSRLSTAGASSDDNSSCISSSVSQPIILVLGNEGHGLRTNILNKCTHLVKIPRMTVAMGARAGEEEGEESHHVDSLNVSVAGGILLHSLLNLQDK
jgi:21S rRNA (GM2251-2'-O)-methyltransferase